MPLKTLGQINPRNSLIIFDRFEVDDRLPKHQGKASLELEEDEEEGGTFVAFRSSRRMREISNPISISGGGVWSAGLINSATGAVNIDAFQRVIEAALPKPWWKRLFSRSAQQKVADLAPLPPPEVSVLEVFENVKLQAEALSTLNLRQDELITLLAQAEAAGQRDLVKKIQQEWDRLQLENLMYASGVRKYLTEAQLLEFVTLCEKGLCLDWVKNFVRVIPKEALDAKLKYDEAKIFDNYCILHYDPDQTATTKESRDEAAAKEEKRRDPILFGLVQGVRKLYFVADWIDDQCNLTFEDVIAKLGKPLDLPDTVQKSL